MPPELRDAWIERYSELLGCDACPGSVAVAIMDMLDERKRILRAIPRHRKAATAMAMRLAEQKNPAEPQVPPGQSSRTH